jgi:peptidoglycan/LPS O-acetylase OafA/YrhL
MQYRADIDGLRAVAILPVVLYHAGVTALGGGFVGVDVFFVISGFLITSLVVEEIDRGDFSIASFYERRARRILPALFVMLAVTLVIGALVLLPMDFQALTRSAVAATLFWSNVHFWQTASYFDYGSGLKPLLHTWSLAVEEQFYIGFPALHLLVARFRAPRRALLAAIFLASLALSIWGVTRYPEATFYLAPTRVWELLAGALVALGLLPPIRAPFVREAAGLVGAAIIAWCVLTYDDATPFPGLAALWPCLGAVLIIHARGSAVSRLLALRPFVFIGLLSYSLYLWHWPVIVFARYQGYFLGTPAQTLAVIAASTLLALLSWRFVEQPVKARRVFATRPAVFRGAGLAAAAVLAFSFGLGVLRPETATEVAAFEAGRAEARAAYGEGECFFSSDAPLASIDPGRCLGADPRRPSWLLIGDSFAAHLWPGLNAALSDVHLSQFTFGGCPPLIDAPRLTEAGCRKVNDAVFASVEETRYDTVLMAARWHAGDTADLEATIRYLKPRVGQIVLFGPMVEYRGYLPEILAEGDDPDRVVMKYRLIPDLEDRALRTLADSLGVRYVSMVDLMCTGERCLLFDQTGAPILWDTGHLTAEGSVNLMHRAAVSGALPPPYDAPRSTGPLPRRSPA